MWYPQTLFTIRWTSPSPKGAVKSPTPVTIQPGPILSIKDVIKMDKVERAIAKVLAPTLKTQGFELRKTGVLCAHSSMDMMRF